RSGVTIRTKVDQIRVAGRATQGVKIINLREGDVIASVMAVPVSEEEEQTDENIIVNAEQPAAESITAEEQTKAEE
ncbi:MAG: hypothetical protein IIX31_07205, partial [Alistipes sp.]|nr:hypothetical protein [Alistipes sp.]